MFPKIDLLGRVVLLGVPLAHGGAGVELGGLPGLGVHLHGAGVLAVLRLEASAVLRALIIKEMLKYKWSLKHS